MYRPLPDCLTIKNSEVDGLGVFAKEDIPADTFLGVSHIKIRSDWNRTPLGGFYNHSDNANCKKYLKKNMFSQMYHLWTTKDIKEGEEITVEYTLYKIK